MPKYGVKLNFSFLSIPKAKVSENNGQLRFHGSNLDNNFGSLHYSNWLSLIVRNTFLLASILGGWGETS